LNTGTEVCVWAVQNIENNNMAPSPSSWPSPLLIIALAVALACFPLPAHSSSPSYSNATVYYNEKSGTYRLEWDVVDKKLGAAWGLFEDDHHNIGWYNLQVASNPKFEDRVQM